MLILNVFQLFTIVQYFVYPNLNMLHCVLKPFNSATAATYLQMTLIHHTSYQLHYNMIVHANFNRYNTRKIIFQSRDLNPLPSNS